VASIVDGSAPSGIEHGEVLTAFAEALVTGEESGLARTRHDLTAAMGPAAMVDALGVASNFERMVRIADATGIELGAYLEGATAEVREVLRIERPFGR
jgi:hypothetical protein